MIALGFLIVAKPESEVPINAMLIGEILLWIAAAHDGDHRLRLHDHRPQAHGGQSAAEESAAEVGAPQHSRRTPDAMKISR